MIEEIKHLALQGESNVEIGKKLNLDPIDYIPSVIYRMEEKTKIEILLARTKRKEQERMEKLNEILEVADEIKNGKTLLEIAITKRKRLEEIAYLMESLRTTKSFKNLELYQELKTKEKENKEDLEALYKRLQALEALGYQFKNYEEYPHMKEYKKYLKAEKMFEILEKNQNQILITDLEMKSGLHTKDIRKILNGTLFPKLKEEKLRGRTSEEIEKNFLKKQEEERVKFAQFDLPVSLTEEEKRIKKQIDTNIKLWYNVVLTYRISFDDLVEILGFSNPNFAISYFYQNLEKYPKEYKKAIYFLHQEGLSIPKEEKEQRKEKVRLFLKYQRYQLTKEYKEKYEEEVKKLGDKEVLSILKNKEAKNYTEEDWEKIARFRIKYALAYSFFPFDADTFLRHIPNELIEENEKVSDFNRDYTKNNEYRRR